LVLNPDELGQDPAIGMDLAVELGVAGLEIRTAWDRNVMLLDDTEVHRIRALADERGLVIESLASPFWKWCFPEATPGHVDSFGFPTRVAVADRERWVRRGLRVAAVLGASRVRVFSHLRVEPELTEDFLTDPLLERALGWARDGGVRLLLENEPVCTTASAHAVAAALRRHASAGLGLWLDVANFHQLGEDTVAVVTELASYADYVHIKDYLPAEGPGQRPHFRPAGAGVVPYGQVLTVLAAAAPDVPWALETHVRDDPRQALIDGAAYLRTATDTDSAVRSASALGGGSR